MTAFESMENVTAPFLISGTIPNGGIEFSATITLDVIVLRVGDRICVAAPRWMTPEQARTVRDALDEVTA